MSAQDMQTFDGIMSQSKYNGPMNTEGPRAGWHTADLGSNQGYWVNPTTRQFERMDLTPNEEFDMYRIGTPAKGEDQWGRAPSSDNFLDRYSLGLVGGLVGLGALGAAGSAAGSAMPAAQALSPEALASMGLTETAPGVFANAGNYAAFGGLGGAGAGLAQGGGIGTAGSQAIGLPAATPAPPPLPTPSPVSSVGATGGAAGGASGAGAAAGGSSFADSLIKQMKDNALGLGLMGIGTAASLGAGKAQMPNEAELQGLGTEAAATARQLMAQYRTGNLSAGQQASLDQLTQNTKNQLRQYFASIGQSDSSAAAQAMMQVDQTALQMKQQMLDTALQQGLSAVGVASGPLNTIAQYQLGQDQQLKQAFGNFAGGVGMLFGRNAGAPKSPTTSATTPQQQVSSTQAPQQA